MRTRLIPLAMAASSLLLVAVCGLWKPIGGVVYHHTGWIAAGHLVVQLMGVWIIAQ